MLSQGTAAMTMIIMSVGRLVTLRLLSGPHSTLSHLHFHWQLFSPHKKFKTAICESCLAKWKCGGGGGVGGGWMGVGEGEGRVFFKSQLFVL